MDGAAGGGHLEVCKWLAANRAEGCSQAAFELAAAGGHLDVITVRKSTAAARSRYVALPAGVFWLRRRRSSSNCFGWFA